MPKKRQRLFSESWHLVAGRHAVLRPAVEARRQTYRGDPWYVLYDPLRQEYFRITEGAYNFIARLNKGHTIDHVWRTCMEENPDETPVQDEVIQLLAQLNQSNLLETDLPQDAGKMYEARNKMREKKIRAQALNFLFVRVPLFDPDFLFKPLGKLLKPFCTLAGFIVWLGWMFFGLKLFIDHFGEFAAQRQGLLAPENLVWLFVATVGLKALHEVGHGVVCRAFGGGVHKIGIMFLIFMPLPYVDASSSWSFTSKWRRVAVASAGMMVELAIAVGALWLWANTGDAATRTLTYNIVVVASVGTILFNMNPLLKFDGYYIMSDWLGVPNLQQRAQSHLIYIGERHLFGVKGAESKVRSFGEATFLATYGIAAFCYRIFLMFSIALLVSEQYFELGIAIAALLALTAFVIPLGKFANYLLFSPKLDEVRGAALITVGLVLVLIATFLLSFKVEDRFTAPGVLQELSEVYMYSPAAGFVQHIHVDSGDWVEQGQILITLSNPELDLEIRVAEAIIEQREFYFQLAQRQDFTTLSVWQSMIRNERERLRLLQTDRENLAVRAHAAGIWFSPDIRHMYGMRVERGQEIGRLVQPHTSSFIAVVSQTQAAKMFDGADWRAEIRFHGRAGYVLPASVVSVVESGRRVLPSAALGWTGGGTIKTVETDQTGRIAAEDFFEVRLMLDAEQVLELNAVNGQRARVRIATGDITVGAMIWRWVRQLLQRRLQL